MPRVRICAGGARQRASLPRTTPLWLAPIPRERWTTARRRREDGEKREARAVIGKMIGGQNDGSGMRRRERVSLRGRGGEQRTQRRENRSLG